MLTGTRARSCVLTGTHTRLCVTVDARWNRPAGDELATHDGHIAWGVDAQPDLPPLEPDDRDANIVADIESFHELAG